MVCRCSGRNPVGLGDLFRYRSGRRLPPGRGALAKQRDRCRIRPYPGAEQRTAFYLRQSDYLEAYVNGRELVSWSKEYSVPIGNLFVESQNISVLADHLECFVNDQAAAMAIAVTLLDPEVVVLGGGVIEMKASPFEKLVKKTRVRLQSPEPANSVRFVKAKLDRSAAVYGGMCLSLKRERGLAVESHSRSV